MTAFDSFAKKASGTAGISRRTLTRGAAWSVPVLVAGASAALAAASLPAPGAPCSNSGQGTCANSKCNGNSQGGAKFNNNAQFFSVCGGEAAGCTVNDPTFQCAPLTTSNLAVLVCTTAGGQNGVAICRRTCTTDAGCNVAGGQVCVDYGTAGKFCALPCTTNSQCSSSATCASVNGSATKYCYYAGN